MKKDELQKKIAESLKTSLAEIAKSVMEKPGVKEEKPDEKNEQHDNDVQKNVTINVDSEVVAKAISESLEKHFKDNKEDKNAEDESNDDKNTEKKVDAKDVIAKALTDNGLDGVEVIIKNSPQGKGGEEDDKFTENEDDAEVNEENYKGIINKELSGQLSEKHEDALDSFIGKKLSKYQNKS